ncbi:hypothetical protein BACUNI_03825 [Bacteroides uniformis ATCC 8492]|uniref:Uncharacterized protein n=1 Tax=Bacteroides uniformis (strain ATCC 8492 / DSM 6597 / CCUG 4942 / CIP 103695 / JCM 5828 / KCTC 5204 / NCTC 13054 / VPI 0061) TaxID=411479 RepID=A0ABC9N6C5_BACUC|nr:hypothetical protein BACUNI_03825 [Bacteroides uniformis ATCC 8492]
MDKSFSFSSEQSKCKKDLVTVLKKGSPVFADCPLT